MFKGIMSRLGLGGNSPEREPGLHEEPEKNNAAEAPQLGPKEEAAKRLFAEFNGNSEAGPERDLGERAREEAAKIVAAMEPEQAKQAAGMIDHIAMGLYRRVREMQEEDDSNRMYESHMKKQDEYRKHVESQQAADKDRQEEAKRGIENIMASINDGTVMTGPEQNTMNNLDKLNAEIDANADKKE